MQVVALLQRKSLDFLLVSNGMMSSIRSLSASPSLLIATCFLFHAVIHMRVGLVALGKNSYFAS
jgi:hypothetical protein